MVPYLAYVSRQTYSLNDADLEKLLQQARDNNQKMDITGMLIYYEGLFIQYIEGPAENLKILYDRIAKDRRHEKITLLDSGENEEREFKDWSMSFEKLSKDKAFEICGYHVFNKEDVFRTAEDKTHPALELLSNYVRNL